MIKTQSAYRKLLPKEDIMPILFDESLLSEFSSEHSRIILEFIKTVLEKGNNVNLGILHKNISGLTFHQINPTSSLARNFTGYCDYSKNEIYYLNESDIFHELLHVSSTVMSKPNVLSGFYQYKCPGFLMGQDIGCGLNEGYSAYLEAYFFNTLSSYPILETIARILSKTLDGTMEKRFFSADLKGLVDDLSDYVSIDQVMTFLSEMDFIEFYSMIYSFKHNKECVDLYYETIMFTFKTLIHKLLKDYENGLISRSDANNMLASSMLLVPDIITLKTGVYFIPYFMNLFKHIPDISNITIDDVKRFKLEI